MISPKFIFFGISGTLVTAGSLAAWQLTKGTNLPTLSQISNLNPEQQKLEEKIKEECGESLYSDWYINGEENGYHALFDSKGEKLKSDSSLEAQADKTKGYYKKNKKGKNADEYTDCKNNIKKNK